MKSTLNIASVAVPLILAVVLAVFSIHRGALWTPDGYTYARMMLIDQGESVTAAAQHASAFYLNTPVGKNSRYRQSIFLEHRHAPPERIFAERVAYPFAASLFYPWAGFFAMILVSAVAYVLAIGACVWFFALFVPLWLAAAGATVAALLPMERLWATGDVTDMLAFLFWVVTLAAMSAYVKTHEQKWLAAYTIAVVALALTRPAAHLPLFGAGALFLWGVVRQDHTLRRDGLRLMGCAVAGVIAYTAARHLTNAYSFAEHLAWLRSYLKSGPTPAGKSNLGWLGLVFLGTIFVEVKHWIRAVVPTLAAGAATIGYMRSHDRTVPFFVGAALALLFSLAANPIAWDVPRTIELPAQPLLILGCILALRMFFERAIFVRSDALRS